MAILCAACDKNITRYDDYVVCRGKCECNFHIGCVDITIEKLTHLKGSGSIKTWTCETCVEDLTSKCPPLSDRDSSECKGQKNLEEFIMYHINNAVDTITSKIITTLHGEVANLKIENRNLQSEIKELKEIVKMQYQSAVVDFKTSTKEVAKSRPINKSMECLQEKRTQTHDAKNTNNKTDLTQEKIIEKERIQTVQYDVKNTNNKTDLTQEKIIETERKQTVQYSEVVKKDLGHHLLQRTNNNVTRARSDDQTASDNEFTVVKRRQRRSNITTINGTATNIELKGTIRYAHLHVSGLDPGTSVSDVEIYLQNKKITSVKCFKINAKKPDEYASFKVSVPIDMLEPAKKPELWPSGVRISRFLERIFRKAKQT